MEQGAAPLSFSPQRRLALLLRVPQLCKLALPALLRCAQQVHQGVLPLGDLPQRLAQ